MNIVTIKFGQGTKAWEDMEGVVAVLREKGYSVEPYEEIGTVKLSKEIVDESSDEDKGAIYHPKLNNN